MLSEGSLEQGSIYGFVWVLWQWRFDLVSNIVGCID